MISGIAFLTVITAAVTATLIEAARRRMPRPPASETATEFMREVTARLSAIEARLDELGTAIRRLSRRPARSLDGGGAGAGGPFSSS